MYELLITVQCRGCGHLFDAHVDLEKLDFEVFDAYERQMGYERDYDDTCEIECPKCGTFGFLAFAIYEYPLGFCEHCDITSSDYTFDVILYDFKELRTFCDDYLSEYRGQY